MKLTTQLGCQIISSDSPLRFAIWWVLAGVFCLATGCGDGRPALFPASGTVEFTSGQPVRNASIEFVPTGGGPSPRARIDGDGKFKLGTFATADGAPVGEYYVIVVQPLPPEVGRIARQLGEEHAQHAASIEVVSVKHSSLETTEIQRSVEAGSDNQFKIVVEPQ